MQHYDGPAFYRKIQKQTNRKQAQKKNFFNRTKEVYADNKTSQPLMNEIDRKTRASVFKPTYVPPSAIHKESFSKRILRYHRILQELSKKPESFFLLSMMNSNNAQKELILMDNGSDDQGESKRSILALAKSDSEISDDLEQVQTSETKVRSRTDFSSVNKSLSKSSNKAAASIPVLHQAPDVKLDSFPTKQNEKRNKVSELQKKFHMQELTFKRQDEIVANQAEKHSSGQKTAVELRPSSLSEPLVSNLNHGLSKKTDKKQLLNADNLLRQQTSYRFPASSLLPRAVMVSDPSMNEWVRSQRDTLNDSLRSFKVNAQVNRWTIGPAVTQFEVTLGRGVKVSKITNLADDLKLALAARDIRIEAPIPGKSSVGIEVPNFRSRPVMLSEVLESDNFKESSSPLTVALGVDLFGRAQVTDLRKMPHGLIAGATGSGKSVFINSLLLSLLYKATPAQVKLLLIDPKAVEMAPYHDIPHLLAPVISDPQAASAALKWVVQEMEERYQRLAAAGARNIESYNKKADDRRDYGLKMPYIVIVIDELADLMMIASSEVQDCIARITQKARAAGIHLLIATQRPSVDVITGTIKNNIPTRIAFMVSSQVDSRTIIDTAGAERLLGRGDMLYLGNGASQPLRLQGTFVQDEVDKITEFVRSQGKPHYAFDPAGLKKMTQEAQNEDPIFPRVLDYIVNEKNISTSKLQRVFSVGYNRAANLIDELEQKQFVSPAHGSKPRAVFLTQKELSKLRE
ncbi:DNA translocase FtsK [Liquorilactobacillus oeni]|uniref:Cell division protein FtsK n=1 Tax=Liquorilactobacillus oeni DSM 19972 TaxID=1423777 RepID=A0A0R1M950_9LACO|nr:DNA translocase FtsK [Liquorilactobacillus oeni]KRL04759.1 cell division protein FtsK [Liquorilactobacillus oeni DSM 19972]